MKRWDRRGLEGLPLKLMIVALLIALSAPAVLGSVEGFERSATRAALQAEASSLVAIAQEAFQAGEGNRRTATIEVPGNGNDRLALAIGGDGEKTESLSVRCLQEDQIVSTIMLDHPMVRLHAPGDVPLVLGPGKHDLLLSCVMSKGNLFVDVEVVG